MSQDPSGFEILNSAHLNKSTAFSEAERDELGLRGLLPPAVCSQDNQLARVLENMRRKAFDIERFVFLQALQARNERLFYRLVIDHVEEVMPLIYTPTVGQACQEFAHIFRQPKGLYVSARDKGSIRKVLNNWPESDVKVVVVTDGERILGLGDLGANGMGIPVGKLSLYTALAGINPSQTLPIMLDVGTNNEPLREDPLYLGLNQPRVRGDEYSALVDELMESLVDAFPNCLIQFEDFATPNAYALLNRYQTTHLCFNDDIQGTAAVSLAGIYSASRVTGQPLAEMTIMFLGAGSAATGIGDLLVDALMQEGLSREAAQARLWFVDTGGLLVASRTQELLPHNLPYAHDHAELDFVEAIRTLQPNVLIGATGAPGTFTQEVIEAISSYQEVPVVFALSNPTARAECTAEEAYSWSQGRVLFSSGSPFDPVEFEGNMLRPGQGNNAYVFPGLGLGAVFACAKHIPSELFITAARTLADDVSEDLLAVGCLYPELKDIRNVSLNIATNVAEHAYELGLARRERPQDLKGDIAGSMFQPYY